MQEELEFEPESVIDKRPTKLPNDLKLEVMTKIANSLIESGITHGYTTEEVIEDLEICDLNEDGFQIGKDLEDMGYEIDTEAVFTLDDISYQFRMKLKEYQRRWVKLKNLKPKYSVGDKLKKEGFIFKLEGDIFYVTKIYEQDGEYVIGTDPKKETGRLLTYEEAEENFSKVDKE